MFLDVDKKFPDGFPDQVEPYVKKKYGKQYDKLRQDYSNANRDYIEAQTNLDGVMSYIKALQGEPMDKFYSNYGKYIDIGSEYVRQYKDDMIKYDKLNDVINPLYQKRYDGSKLTKEEIKTLNNASKQVAEIEEKYDLLRV